MPMSQKTKGNWRFNALRAKPAAYWLKFVGFFSLVGFLGYQSAAHSIANIVWQQNPGLALQFAHDHPLALSLKADMQFLDSQNPDSLLKVEAIARQSLKGQPLNAVAVRLLGYFADVRGDKIKARKLMMLAHKISRRDFGTQLWLIEDAVAKGDKRKALYHYDIAMRATISSHQILFPTLVGALNDPEVREGLAPYIRHHPNWLPGFLAQAITTSQNLTNVVDLLIDLGRLPNQDSYEGLSNALLSTLATKSKFVEFRRYYRSLVGANDATFGTVSLNNATVGLRYPVAGWQLTNNPEIGGAFSLPNRFGRYTVTMFAGSGERGELMRKYLFLKPGRYRFAARYDAIEDAPDGEIRWDMQCLSAKGNSIVWFSVSPINKGKSATAQDFSLDGKCPHQMLNMQVAGGSNQQGIEFILRSVNIASR